MKYVRTKGGRILKVFCENVPLSKEIDGFTYYGKTTTDFDTSHWLPKGQIFKQADTIEELCDKYYGVDENGKVVRVHNWSKDSYPPKPHEWAVDGFCTKKDITISELKNRFPKGIFGAVVWFDNKSNLHIDIVAKMNDKGELKLL